MGIALIATSALSFAAKVEAMKKSGASGSKVKAAEEQAAVITKMIWLHNMMEPRALRRPVSSSIQFLKEHVPDQFQLWRRKDSQPGGIGSFDGRNFGAANDGWGRKSGFFQFRNRYVTGPTLVLCTGNHDDP